MGRARVRVRVRVQRPHGRPETTSGQTQCKWQDGGGRRQTGLAVGAGAVGVGDPGGQPGTQVIHAGDGEGTRGEAGAGGLLYISRHTY